MIDIFGLSELVAVLLILLGFYYLVGIIEAEIQRRREMRTKTT
jgi:hypothetical protein